MFDRCRRQRTGRLVVRGAVGAAVLVLGVGGLAGTASADEDTGSTDGNVQVDASISLTGLTASFLLTGTSGDTVSTAAGDVTYNVKTNNIAGYAVTVQSETATMLPPDTVANPNSIPITALSARDAGVGSYVAVAAPLDLAGTTVHTQAGKSASTGDNLSTDFQVVIPFVNSDTYTATLDYVAATLV